MRRVVLYNPRAVFWTMPLALVALGSALDRTRTEVVIVDGRLEADPVARILALLDDDAVVFGVTVLTGAPIRDALAVTRAVHRARPRVPVVWGGWHPSLFPEQCLREPAVAAVVVGQGEIPFAALVERLAAGEPVADLPGVVTRGGRGPAATLGAVDTLPAHDYDLIPVERYFAAKGRRQLDYISSQGCRFRCSFCADPTVYGRAWVGLAPERVGEELSRWHQRFQLDEIAFQDETFFTHRGRVEAIAEALIARGMSVPWTATMRADQGARLDETTLLRCKQAGLRRVMIGVESGSPATLARIQKDVSVEQVLVSAEKVARLGIGAILNFIVGFPGEDDADLQATMDLVVQLRAMSPDFEAPIFFYRPYPGNPIADALVRDGYTFPDTLEGWADFDYTGGREAWMDAAQHERVARFAFYQRVAFGRRPAWALPLVALSRWRLRHRFFRFPVDKRLVERLRPPTALS